MRKKYRIKNNEGQSLAELIIALGIFSVIIAFSAVLILGNLSSVNSGFSYLKASFLSGEAVAAVFSIRNRAWNEFVYNRSAVSVSGGKWEFSGEGTNEEADGFTRLIDFTPVYRDSSGAIVSSGAPGAYEDVLSRILTVTVSWQESSKNKEVSRKSHLSAWKTKWWEQSDWSGGEGQNVWSDASKYYSDDDNIDISAPGSISLALVATSTYAGSGYLYSSSMLASGTYAAIMWTESIPPSCPTCDVMIQIKTAPDTGGVPGQWSSSWCGPDGEDADESDYYSIPEGELISTDHNGEPWVKYRIRLVGDSSYTPVFSDIKIYYQ